MHTSTFRTSTLAAAAALAISLSTPAQAKCHVAEAWKTYEIDEVIAKSNPPQVSYLCTGSCWLTSPHVLDKMPRKNLG